MYYNLTAQVLESYKMNDFLNFTKQPPFYI